MKGHFSLFYQYDKDRPVAFYELRQLGSMVWTASGKTRTWGEAQTLHFDDEQAAAQTYAQLRQPIASAGFVLAREGVFDTASLNLAELTMEIREGTRKTCQAIRAAHPGQTVNAFALMSDSDGMTLIHAANSREALQAAGDDEYIAWNPVEWPLIDGGDFLDIAYRMILLFHRDIPCEMATDDISTSVFAACITALEQLNQEEFFCTADQRDDLLLLFQTSDGEPDVDVIKRLNTEKNYAKYQKLISRG